MPCRRRHTSAGRRAGVYSASVSLSPSASAVRTKALCACSVRGVWCGVVCVCVCVCVCVVRAGHLTRRHTVRRWVLQHIQRLFGGTFWGVDGIAKVSLRDVVVVVRDDELGASVLAKAMNMVSGEVERRQRDVRRLAPYFHWNANTNTSAIRMWFAAVLGERPPATVAQLRARGRALSTPQP